MSGFLERLLSRTADPEPTVRPRLDLAPLEEPRLATDWGEFVEEVSVPLPPRPVAAASSDGDGPPARDQLSEAGAAIRLELPSLPAQPARAAGPIGRVRLETPLAARPIVAATADTGLLPVARDGRGGSAAATSTTGPAPLSVPVTRDTVTPQAMSIRPTPVEPAGSRQLIARDRMPETQPHGLRTSEVGPDVVISIGRIEVRAPASTRPVKRDSTPDTSRLDGYLEARTGQAHR